MNHGRLYVLSCLTARRFVALLKTNGINVSEAYVFGSAILNKHDLRMG
jgi:hypothetical protein